MTVISGTYDISAVADNHAPATVTGIVAENYQTVQQDFYLSPICEVFGDDMESGVGGWTHGGTPNNWALVTTSSHSPTHSWTDSPSGNYPAYANTWLQSQVLDLSDYAGTTLSFWHRYATESGYDYANVEYSTNGGSTWTTVQTYDGSQTTWTQAQIAIPALDGQANARIRFHLTSDSNTQYDGWYIDDVSITGGGPACQPLLAPTAEFSSNSPVILGQPMIFTNQTTGTVPLSYWWDFGDGVGASTYVDPTYIYSSTGTFTVTLVATNSVGVDSISHPVVVEPPACVEVVGVTIGGETSGAPGTYTFTASFEPPNADPPVTFEWDNGDTTSNTVRTLDEGIYTLVVTATNCTSALVTDTHTIAIERPRLYFYLPLIVKNP
jgi:PKD repeat protein